MAAAMAPHQPSCRLYVVLARDGRSAVIFRRGPSKQVCLIRWRLDDDTLEIGQWFKGRIYERRSDLSPNGDLLVYFAARHNGALPTWTAVSRPPFLTALALWEGFGAWGGGGLFSSRKRLGLNHIGPRRRLQPGYTLPGDFVVEPVAYWAGQGEDHLIEQARMERDGWRMVARGTWSGDKGGGQARRSFIEPELYERPQPTPRHARVPVVTLRRELWAAGIVEGPWRSYDFVLGGPAGELRRFRACDWADWDDGGGLLIATGGSLYRLSEATARVAATEPLAGARLVADLAPLRFEKMRSPAAARRWP
jgi:hypothetical protein